MYMLHYRKKSLTRVFMLSHIGDLAGLHVKITMEFSDTKRPSHTVPNVTLLSNETKKLWN